VLTASAVRPVSLGRMLATGLVAGCALSGCVTSGPSAGSPAGPRLSSSPLASAPASGTAAATTAAGPTGPTGPSHSPYAGPARASRSATPSPAPPRGPATTSPPAAARTIPRTAPALLVTRLRGLPATATQVISVVATGYGGTTSTLQAFSRVGGTWRLAFGPETAYVGEGGFAPPGAKREGDGRTPSGLFGFGFAFGVAPNPGVRLGWRPVLGSQDVWDDDPSSPSYNLWVDTTNASAGLDPEPMDNRPAYDLGAVIAYNTARTPGLGSAIFLHVATGGPTAGCVSLPYPQLVPLLRWLDPVEDPVIVMGTAATLGV